MMNGSPVYIADPLTRLNVMLPTAATYYTTTAGAYVSTVSEGPGNYIVGQGQTSPPSILPLQVATSSPDLPTLAQATGMLSADKSTTERISANFDPELYDVTEASHLTRFLRALMGDSGAGQLRKRYTVTRLTSILDSTHFYDLDGFYGSLLSVPRRADERLPVDPMDPSTGMASQDDWDTLMAADARYRERIINLARSLLMAGTPQGIKAMAEVLTDAPCQVTETWKLLDIEYANKPANTWTQVEGEFANWDAMSGDTWDEVAGVVHLGYEGIDTPDEAVITTFKSYEDYPTAEAQQAARSWDESEILRVLDIIKPAGVLLSVNSSGIVNTIPVIIGAVAADSEYWSITKTVYPSTTSPLSDLPPTYQAAVESGSGLSVPLPPFSASQQYEWFVNSSVSQVTGRVFSGTFDLATGANSGAGNNVGNNGWSKNFETIYFPAVGQSLPFYPGYAVVAPRVLLGGQSVADSVMVAHPYAASRTAGKVLVNA